MPEPIHGGNNILTGPSVSGSDQSGPGVTGQSNTGPGVYGQSIGQGGTGPDGTAIPQLPAADGVLGEGMNGVRGLSSTEFGTGAAPAGAGVWGANSGGGKFAVGCGPGVYGTSASGDGVLGSGYHGIHGQSSASGGAGVWGEDTGSGVGVSGSSKAQYGISGQTTSGVAIYGKSVGSGLAGQFVGGVTISGKVTLSDTVTSTSSMTATDLTLSGGDCAEQFDALDAAALEPGTLVVIGDAGMLLESFKAYDHRVAGVISGAGDYTPGIILDRRVSSHPRAVVALVGKVCCKVEADSAPIEIGDLITTSHLPGVGMKATDSARAFGSVIGKALKPLKAGRGLIPILVTLR
jgi:hypothetical protein